MSEEREAYKFDHFKNIDEVMYYFNYWYKEEDIYSINRYLSLKDFNYISNKYQGLQKENQELKRQLHDASIQIQELIEKDIWCPSNREKLEKLQQENKQLKDKLSKIETLIINHNCDTGDIYYKYNSKFLKSELKQRILEIVYEEGSDSDE